jgi:hypothetical protein
MEYIYSLLWKSDGSEGIAWHIRGIEPDGSFLGEIRFDSTIPEKRKISSASGIIPNKDWSRCCKILEEFSKQPIDKSSIKSTSTPTINYASLWRRDKSYRVIDIPFIYNLGDENINPKAKLFIELKEIIEKEISKSYDKLK